MAFFAIIDIWLERGGLVPPLKAFYFDFI